MSLNTKISRFFWPLIIVLSTAGIIFLSSALDQTLAPSPAADPQPPPTFSARSGVYEESFSLTLTIPRLPEAQIIYTTNGRPPTPESAAVYQSPIPLSAAEPNITVIRARTIFPDGTMSDEASGSYVMGTITNLPIVSLVAAPNDLWGEERGILSNPTMSGREWERVATITYLDENGRLGFQEPVGVRLHGQASRFYEKQSLRLYFRRDYGLGRLNYSLFPESDVTSFDRLVIHSGGQDIASSAANWTLMRTQLMAKLARQIEIPTTYNQPVLLFLNGELWGIYHLRERADETFFQDHYGIDPVQIVDSPHRENAQTTAADAWLDLEAYAAENDLADPDNYAYVTAQIDVDSMIDYYILQMYAANSDWPYNNERLFRQDDPLGRWQWFLWDVDYSFGMMPRSDLNFDMVAWLMTPETPEVQIATRFFRSLWDNPDFRSAFLVRAADLLNTVLAPENVSAQLAEVERDLASDIGYEIARWGSPGNWNASAAEMHTFAEQRTAIVRQQFVDGFDLPGTAVLTLNPPAAGQGTVLLNERLTPDLPFTGSYFMDTTITLTAVPEPGYRFVGWQINGRLIEDNTPTLRHLISENTTIAPHFK